ncbi:MAG: FHA domain-containing protein [Rhodanobacteraceae bacterium]
MRIAFVNASREPFQSAGARVRIGADADNDLVPGGAGVAKRHLAIVEDRRGLVLEVLPGAQHVYVNARPVRERGLLRYGDTLSVGGCKLLLLPDNAATGESVPPKSSAAAAQRPGYAALRVVSGAWSGRLLPIEQRLSLGVRGSSLAGIPEPCHLQVGDEGLFLDAGDATAMVNGSPRRRATLEAGDQLVLGEYRFVVEAPGLQARSAALARPYHEPVPVPVVIEKCAPRAEIGWLIGTAALLALALALLLLRRHW